MTGRALSDVIGYVALFGVVSLAVAVIALGGMTALEDTRDRERVSNAVRAFDVLADNLVDVYAEGAPSRATELSLEGATLSTARTLTIQVRAFNGTGWVNLTRPTVSDVPTWRAVGGTERIVYGLGSVLRTDTDEGLVVRNGPFKVASDRTILPIVRTSGRRVQSMSGGIVRVRAVGSNPSLAAIGDAGPWNELWVNLSTAAPGTWRRHLEDYQGVSCLDTPTSWDVACSLPVPDQLYVAVHTVRVELER